MHSETKKVVIEVSILIALWCIIGEILIYIFMGVDSKAMLGFLLGSAMAVASFIHMAVSLENSLDFMNEESAKNNTVKTFLIRVIAIAVIMVLATATGRFNMLFVVFGLLGLKAGAYIQPLADKIFSRFT